MASASATTHAQMEHSTTTHPTTTSAPTMSPESPTTPSTNPSVAGTTPLDAGTAPSGSASTNPSTTAPSRPAPSRSPASRASISLHHGSLTDRGRSIYLKGVNLDSMSKMPSEPHVTTFHGGETFWQGDDVSFVGRPFSLDEADGHFDQIRQWGFNTIRYIFTWEAIEHKGPGIYDTEFVEFTLEVLRKATAKGFYVFLDPHQDVWGRWSGGSGAPMWTYYACGMDPRNFDVTRAAIVQNVQNEPHLLPKMLWPTNYYRLACLTIFTLFMGGERLAPKCIINGVNIQTYLQQHFLDACMVLYKAVEAAGLFGPVFGIENMNEPNMGLVGFGDISKVPTNQNLRLGSTPTAFQSMLLGAGIPQSVDTYLFGSLGPKHNGKATFDPKGVKAWVTSDEKDRHYGWTRGPQWELGRCVWAIHGVWDDTSNTLLKPHYFANNTTKNEVNEKYAVDEFFLPYWKFHYTALRAQLPTSIWLLCQPPCLFPPPLLKGTALIDKHVIYAPHWYDGLTLMLKRWSTLWNVDSLGYLRGHYKLPLFAIKIGEGGIRHGISRQLAIMAKEGKANLGEDVPCLMSETGIPMDMNNKESFMSHNYTSQIKALDAISAALEHNQMHFTYWCFSTSNSYERGDQWNHEDFSLISEAGPRAQEAYIRPAPTAVAGHIVSTHFHLSNCHYRLEIDGDPVSEDTVTEVFVPSLHYPKGGFSVNVSAGTWEIDGEVLKWKHGVGRATLTLSRGGWCCIA